MADQLGEALAAIGPGDTSGTETLARYHYQCRVAVQRWLLTLGMSDDAFVLCEFVDDITTVGDREVCFAQVKTRDRGAWSAARVLAKGGGIDALVRSYNLTKSYGASFPVKLQLILEGPAGTGGETATFFSDPTAATEKQRQLIVGLGIVAGDVDDFLRCLTIVSQYHPRLSIDAVTVRLLMVLAPGHSAQIEELYDSLLKRSIEAHTGSSRAADPNKPLALQLAARPSDSVETLREHRLTRAELLKILPLKPEFQEEQRHLLEAANDGSTGMSDLEWKLRVAGASENTIARAKDKRAMASARLAIRPDLSAGPDQQLEQLSASVLEYADAVTADVVGSASTLAHASRPAEVIYGRLVQQAGHLGDLDRDKLLSGNGDIVLGFLCELSDQCRYGWRSA